MDDFDESCIDLKQNNYQNNSLLQEQHHLLVGDSSPLKHATFGLVNKEYEEQEQ